MLIAPTVLGQEVSTGASSTETSASTNTSTASAGTSRVRQLPAELGVKQL